MASHSSPSLARHSARPLRPAAFLAFSRASSGVTWLGLGLGLGFGFGFGFGFGLGFGLGLGLGLGLG